MKIILSFQPRVFPALCSGLKQFEYRRQFPNGKIEAYIYLSSPVKSIVGKIIFSEKEKINDLLLDDKITSEWKTVGRLKLHQEEGAKYVIPIEKIEIFNKFVSLDDARKIEPNFFAPQTYCYLRKVPTLDNYLEQLETKELVSIKEYSRENFLGLLCNEIYERPDFIDKSEEILGSKVKR
ncbi:hypothetical protein [uncultured Rummeliibacillus sp.]|uniref:hypothetical protein n=1 Tax=uncultured Rummeliibacillus sp. TaxID=762292 RepID=UPI002622992B|nr:hypothetical protein [uncultured Rummeliibacillus sp.]